MDKELLRITIIGTGLIIMVAMIISAYMKNKEMEDEEYDEYDEEEELSADLKHHHSEEDDHEHEKPPAVEPVQKLSLTQTLKNVYSQKLQQIQQLQQQRQKTKPDFDDDVHNYEHHKQHEYEHDFDDDELHHHDDHHDLHDDIPHHEEQPPAPVQKSTVSPSILQFSVITKANIDFNVADVFHALESLGLVYGSMKIFERVDDNRFVHFGVANMVEPGTFPDRNLEMHDCPGVVFFMQFDGLENPRVIFDDYIATAVLFAQQMDGVVLDHRRQPLTNEMVQAIRNAI